MVLIALQSLAPVTSKIQCLDCPLLANNFTYLVTADNVPDKLQQCETKSVGDTCIIEVKWGQNPSFTQIGLVAEEGDRKTSINTRDLNTHVSLENKENSFIWTKSISYTCSTDDCNRLSELRRLLKSLTFNDNLNDLKDILTIDSAFDGSWCEFMYANTTRLECAIPISTNSCMECSYQSFQINNALQICANCFPFGIGESFISHEVDFDLTNSTREDHWMIACQSKSCSTPENDARLRKSVTVQVEFPDIVDRSSHASMNSFFLFCMLFLCISPHSMK